MSAPETREERERLVSSLGLPADAGAPGRYIEHGGPVSGPGLAALVDGEVAERTWRQWCPAQAERLEAPGFRAAFEALLSAGVGMGYRLDRFRSVCQALPDPDPDGERWVEPFERAVVGRNALDLLVHVRSEIRDAFAATNAATGKEDERWDGMVSMMAEGLFYELGIVLPRLELLADDSLAPTELRIEVNDAQLPRCHLLPFDRALVNDTVDRLRQLLNVRGEPAVNPANGSECATVGASDVEICKKGGLTTWTPMGHATLSIAAVVRRMAGGFVNRHLVDFHVERLAAAFPVVVEEMSRAMSSDAIAQVLRALVDEELSIRNLRQIFEILTVPEAAITADLGRYIAFSPSSLHRSHFYRDVNRATPALERRLFRVRCAMARYISHKYTRGSNTLVAYLLDPELEKRLAQPRPLSRRDHAALLRALGTEIGKLPSTAQNPVILTTASIRVRLRREIAADLPYTAVLSYQELSPELNIQPIARIEAPELTDVLARLGPPEGGGSSAVALSQAPEDPLVRSLLATKERVIARANRRDRFGDAAKPLMSECLDAILGELAGESMATQLAGILPGRADVPVKWDRVVELVLTLGTAASDAIERPRTDPPEEPRRFYSDLARIRGATHRLARAIVQAAFRPEPRS